jgi:hypothetical protein
VGKVVLGELLLYSYLIQGSTNYPKSRTFLWVHIVDPQILGATVVNLVAWANWCLGFVHP